MVEVPDVNLTLYQGRRALFFHRILSVDFRVILKIKERGLTQVFIKIFQYRGGRGTYFVVKIMTISNNKSLDALKSLVVY